MRVIDLTGQRFGRLMVIRRDPVKSHNIKWICQCDCGNVKSIIGGKLKRGNTKSCGCYRVEKTSIRKRKHGDSGTKFYYCWLDMIHRCNSPTKPSYKNYGGRGIKVCNRWLTYENFKEDMYESYLIHSEVFGEKDTSIDRININGNYELSNCKWSTWKEQCGNRRTNLEFIGIYTVPGKSYGYVEYSKNQKSFAKKYNLHSSNISECLHGRESTHKGWKFMCILKENRE